MGTSFLNKEEFKNEYLKRMIQKYGRSVDQAHITEKFMILGEMVRDYASENWNLSKDVVAVKQEKQMYYFSMEFLMGRLLTNNMMNLGIYETVKAGLQDLHIDINQLEELESDAGLGNGGLGRLAACFLDSLASMNYAGHGNCIRYEYGLFKQKIVHDQQVEVPDRWLSLGNVWEVRKAKHAVEIKFGGQVDEKMGEDGKVFINHIPSLIVRAVPYDVPIVGQATNMTNTLRLWSAEVADDACDASSLNAYVNEVCEICRNVYPDDSSEHGKILRLKQQYFFVAAGINNIIDSHVRTFKTLDNFAQKTAIQLNDTHPVLAIPEFMRILLDDFRYDWEAAWDVTTQVMAYTNHTVLSEALEKWPIQYIKDLLPRIYTIIQEIDNRFKYDLTHLYQRSDLINECAILKDGQIHMANLAIIGTHSVNGVAALHTQILKNDVMKYYYAIFPEKFNNKTNGITHRRWLLYSNPQLCDLLQKTIGDTYRRDASKLLDLMQHVDDQSVQKSFLAVKRQRKQILADYIKINLGIEVDVNSIFDVQAKRLHAYKRQLLNVMHIIHLYFCFQDDPNFSIHPRTFIFAAKAAPSYIFAKAVIHLIHRVAAKINNDARISKYMKVVFIPNYGVSIAEILMNAADISEQISTAGKEASGTGNMKFMMNGAITLGTMDGANVEIVEKVKAENAHIFGLRCEEILEMHNENKYDAWSYYNENAQLKRIMDSMLNKTFDDNQDAFKIIYNEVMFKNDEYLLLADFKSYQEVQKNIEKHYIDTARWAKACLINIAQSAYFSSDRTIKQYADEIWKIEPTKINE